jgi:hypothetical protein
LKNNTTPLQKSRWKEWVLGTIVFLATATILGLLLDPNFPLVILDYLTPYVEDRSVITQEFCQPPCWRGLVVGESRYEDVYNYVTQDDRFPDWSLSFSDTSIGWFRPGRGEWGHFIFDNNGRLTMFRLKLNDHITIRDIQAVYGAPSVTRLYHDIINHAPTNRNRVLGGELFFPSFGMIVHSDFGFQGDTYEVPLDPTVNQISFYPAHDNLIEFLTNARGNPHNRGDAILENNYFVSGWVGYGVTVKFSEDYTMDVLP